MSKPVTKLSNDIASIIKEVFTMLVKTSGNVVVYLLCTFLKGMRFDLELVSPEGIYYGTNTNIN